MALISHYVGDYLLRLPNKINRDEEDPSFCNLGSNNNTVFTGA